MKCWLCKKELKGAKKFCVNCGVPQGEQIEFASTISGTGYAQIKTSDGEVYDVTFRDYRITSKDKVSC